MKSDRPLDYAIFQLSPKRSRCELFVSSDGDTKKLASGLVKPFVTHLKVAEEQVALAVNSIKLEVKRHNNAKSWFTKGTLERFVRFVSTPEVLELVNTFDAEMSQLEAARKIYSQGAGEQTSRGSGADGTGTSAAADATKKELLRAIDVRLAAVRQDLATAFSHAFAAGFNCETVLELQLFANHFGASRLNESCTKFLTFCQRRSDLLNQWTPDAEDQALRDSCESDMSIDDPAQDQSIHHIGPQQVQNEHPTGSQLGRLQPAQQLSEQSKTSTHQHSKSFANFPQQCTATDEMTGKEIQNDLSTPTEPATQTSQPVRRLSVQDRINLFENKQKENTGGKPITGKPVDLRRLSSDMSSATTPTGVMEKAVLRRWSGASDMSIDSSGGDKKDNKESPACTPTSCSVSLKSNTVLDSSECKESKGPSDMTSGNVEVKSDSSRVGDSGLKCQCDSQPQGGGSSSKKEEVELKSRINLKDQGRSHNQLRSFTGKNTDNVRESKQAASQMKLNVSSGNEERSHGFKDQLDYGAHSMGFVDPAEPVIMKNQPAPQDPIGVSANRYADVTVDSEAENGEEDSRRDRPRAQMCVRGSSGHSRSLSGQSKGGFGVNIAEARYKSTGVNQLFSQPEWRSHSGEVEICQQDPNTSENHPSKFDDREIARIKSQKGIVAATEQTRKSQARRDEKGRAYSKTAFSGKTMSENPESSGTVLTTAVEQVQRVRQVRGNQELNDELKLKANELEKLFAEHKLRAPGDHSSSSRRSRASDIEMEQEVKSESIKSAAARIAPAKQSENSTMTTPSGNVAESGSDSEIRMEVSPDYSDTLRKNFSKIGFSDDSRGKSYERYMQKRDAKLREEWSTRRAEKEAKLKAMQESLEQSKAQMKAKLSVSVDRQDSISGTRRRTQRFRSVNVHSILKMEQTEKDEDLYENFEQKRYGQERFLSEALTGEGALRSSQSKKALSNKNLSSPSPRTGVAVPRSSITPGSNSGKRRMQSENPLAQSVPNFSDFRKESSKSSSGVSQMTCRAQLRNYSRSKSSTEEAFQEKEEKSHRSPSLRKSSAGPLEFKDFSPSSPDVLRKFITDLSDQTFHDKLPINMESKAFLKKKLGSGPAAGAAVSMMKPSFSAESLKDDEDDLTSEEKDLKEDEEEELGTMDAEGFSTMDNGPRLSSDTDKLDNTRSDNCDPLRSQSQVGPMSVAELPPAVPSAFHHDVAYLPDSPGESPFSWNSRMHRPFSYPHETSDIDASVDSPIGSPAFWNSHLLNQTEADVIRMRKKWGSAQKAIFVRNSSQNQSRKDVTKGFKRLLKFGRKNRGTENIADWISATTSEGDDDTEDGRDPASRSSEDLRKSRMGFSQGHPSDDGFNDSEMFSEKVQALQSSIPAPPSNFRLREDHMSGSSLKAPRSFFSLSSFLSKGSDSKPR